MPRPLHSTKPLYNHAPLKVGRPTSPKLTIGYIGPTLNLATDDDLQRALVIGQTIAEHKQLAAVLVEPGVAQALVRGTRDKAGTVIGFTAVKNHTEAKANEQVTGLDCKVYTGSSLTQHKTFLDSLDALIIQTYPQPNFHLRLPITKKIPIGILVNSHQTTQQVTSLVELAHPSGSTIEYAENPKQLVNLIIKQAKTATVK